MMGSLVGWVFRAFLVLTLAGATAALTGSARASFPGVNGSILFTGNDSTSNTDLYSIQPDGTSLQRLTTDPQAEFSPASSPDGRRIAFTKDTAETCGHLFYAQGDEIYVAHADGTGATRLTNNCPTADYMPSWSPSGARLVFVRNGDIWTMRADGTDQAALTCTGADGDGQPRWSPNGDSIAFVRAAHLFSMRPDGSDVRQLTSGAALETDYAFSPDGARLAFVRHTTSVEEGLYVVDIDGAGEQRIDDALDWSPAWSPDGTEIAFNSNRDHPHEATQALYTIRPDGSGLTKVIDDLNAAGADWAPAGGTVVSGSESAVGPSGTACPETAPSATEPPATPVPQTVVPAADVAAPDRLRVATVAFTPRTLRSRRPFVIRIRILEQARGLPVSGAAVTVASVPVGRVRRPVQQLTDTSGTSVIRLRPTKRVQLRPGRLTLAVRIRKPGSPWSDPVSAFRLISIRITPR